MELLEQIWQAISSGNIPELGLWSYIVLAILVIIEGPTITILGAVAASMGAMSPLGVFIAATIGNAIADSGWYLLGYLGRFEVWADKVGFLRRNKAVIHKLEQEMHQHAVKLIVVAKLSISLVVPTLIAAGMARVPWRKWFPIVFGVELLWTGALVVGGYYFSQYASQFETWLQVVTTIGFVVLVLVIIYLVRRVGKFISEAEVDAAQSDQSPAPTDQNN